MNKWEAMLLELRLPDQTCKFSLDLFLIIYILILLSYHVHVVTMDTIPVHRIKHFDLNTYHITTIYPLVQLIDYLEA